MSPKILNIFRVVELIACAYRYAGLTLLTDHFMCKSVLRTKCEMSCCLLDPTTTT